MKCVVYVSRVVTRKNGATIPTGLSEIYNVARKMNAAHKITGVLSYRKGYYIQVLEGGTKEVDTLYSNILSDKRHGRVRLLLDMNISKRSFPDWDMKLVMSVGKDPNFQQFVSHYLALIKQLPKEKLDLFNVFYDTRLSAKNVIKTYEGKDITLLGWPDFTLIKQSPVIIELCARLTSRPYAYSELVSSGHFGTKDQLDRVLRKFETLDILAVVDTSGRNVLQRRQEKESSGFYAKMKNYLRFGK